MATTPKRPKVTPVKTATANVSAGKTAVNVKDLEVVAVPPIPAVISSQTSLFDKAKPGQPVVRPGDLLALRVELVNMKITPGKSGKPPEMAHGGSGDAFIVLHYPPQSIAEQVFFETAPAGMNTPDLPPGAKDKTAGANDTGVAPPPIR